MSGDAGPPRYVSKAKLTSVLKNSFYLSENLVAELLFIIFFKKINIIKANYILNKDNAIELRFLYALIRTYSYLHDVKDFPRSIGHTHLFV